MMDVLASMKETARAVDEALAEILKTPSESLETLYSAMRYSALAPGKRIRPHLVFLFSRLFGGNDKAALPFACAIELVHASSLVHDDMPCMDNDDYRRGRLTCHKVYGEDMALLAGDALITKGYEVAARNEHVSPETALEATRLILNLAGGVGMMGGQEIDLTSENKTIEFETLLEMHAKKTGALIRAACLLGVLSAGISLSDECAAAAEKYAESVGLAFQVRDDLLDVIGDKALLGKNTNADTNKNTFMNFMEIADAERYIQRETEKAKDAIASYDGCCELLLLAEYLAGRNN